MIDVVLRAAAPDFDVEEFLKRFPDLRPDAQWRRGERRLRSRPPTEDAGFNKAIGEGDSWDVAWKRTHVSLSHLRGVLSALTQAGIRAYIDIGILAGGPALEVLQCSLTSSELKSVVKLGLGLTVTVYPVDKRKVRLLSKRSNG